MTMGGDDMGHICEQLTNIVMTEKGLVHHKVSYVFKTKVMVLC